MSDRTAVILAGGLGSRLRPYTLTIPKPLLPLDGVPIIEIVVRQLVEQGFNRVVVCVGYLGEMIEFVLGDGSRLGTSIEYVYEEGPLGTAGALTLVPDLPRHVLVMNGDLLTRLDYADFLRKSIASGCPAGVALHRRTVSIDYGVVEASAKGRLTQYREKPSLDFNVSMGIYVIAAELIAKLTPRRLDMPELLVNTAAGGKGVYTHLSDTYWQDIGRMEDFEMASADFAADPKSFVRNVGREETSTP